MYLQLVADYKDGDDWTVKLLNKYEFSIVPIVNPDGYEYTYGEPGVSVLCIKLCVVTFYVVKSSYIDLYVVNLWLKVIRYQLIASIVNINFSTLVSIHISYECQILIEHIF